MVQRKKPVGKEWEIFATDWADADHATKVRMAEEAGVTYDTAKHWISESLCGTTTPVREKELNMTVGLEELLNSKPATNLDFVCFDIESSNLNADFSVFLTACIKPFGQAPMVFRADDYKEWLTDRANDYRIVVAVAEELRKHAVVVTHYGSRFDIRFLRAKMVKHGLPPLPQMFGVDTWRIAYDNFKISSNRLANLSAFFDLGEKTSVDGDLWMKAAYSGDTKVMDKIVEHNIQDVIILEKLGCLVFPFLKSIRRL